MKDSRKTRSYAHRSIVISALLITVLSFSCSKSSYGPSVENASGSLRFKPEAVDSAPLYDMKMEAPHSQDIPPAQQQTEKKIIKDGRMGVKVDDLDQTKANIDMLLSKYNGYYANESLSNSSYETTMSLVVRIPSANFELLIEQIESGDGEILYKNLDARDVTDQFIDLESRLDNKRAYLLRYRELLKQAKTVEDILNIESEIRQLEEEIDSTQGRLKYLIDQVSLSTLSLDLSVEREFKFTPSKRSKFGEKFKEALSRGWYGFVGFILILFTLWPLLIVVGLVIFLLRKYKVFKKKK